jgi:hypothetical protein
MSGVTIEVGERTPKAKLTVLHGGPEGDRLYALLVDYWPGNFLTFRGRS